MRISSTLFKPAALLLLSVSTFFCCSVANAFIINWSWTPNYYNPGGTGDVTGTITGLVDDLADQKNGVVTVTSAPSTPPGGWGPWSYVRGSGFSIFGGQVTAYDAVYGDSSGFQVLSFGNGSINYPEILLANTSGAIDIEYSLRTSAGTPTVTTTFEAVPVPLPILGIPAVLFYARKLKVKIKQHNATDAVN